MVAHGKSEKFWVRHLLRRAGFGGTPVEIDRYCALGYDKTLAELLNPEQVDNSELDALIKEQNFDFTNLGDLKRWWLMRMAFTRRPLEEKLTLFWHGHFATSDAKVKNPYAMYRQNMLFRTQGLGNFQNLLQQVSTDPAMIVYLDNQQNRKGKPNENYAREIMELFTLGIGNYSEQDIKEAARAFTGWHTANGRFKFNAKAHDSKNKTVLGVTGDLDGSDVVAILASSDATANFLSKKLIKYFAFDDAPPEMVERVARKYIVSKGDMRQTLEALFTDRQFVNGKSYHAKIKSPAELVVGSIKTMQLNKLSEELPTKMARMGQDLFAPPNVKGWDGGTAWIATDTMMERFNFAEDITAWKYEEISQYSTVAALMEKHGLDNGTDLIDYFLELLVDADVPSSTRKRLTRYVCAHRELPKGAALDAKVLGVIHLIMTLPTYQLS